MRDHRTKRPAPHTNTKRDGIISPRINDHGSVTNEVDVALIASDVLARAALDDVDICEVGIRGRGSGAVSASLGEGKEVVSEIGSGVVVAGAVTGGVDVDSLIGVEVEVPGKISDDWANAKKTGIKPKIAAINNEDNLINALL